VQDEGDDDARVIALFLETVYFADLVHQMIDNYMHDCLQGLIDMQDSFTEFAREKKSFEKGIDDLVAKGLESCINIVLERIQITMQADHKPNDYNFKAMKPNMEPTEVCTASITPFVLFILY
jgi:recyclin-1